jgi:hypothetical protein
LSNNEADTNMFPQKQRLIILVAYVLALFAVNFAAFGQNRSVAVLVSIDGSVIVAVLIACPTSSSSFQDRTFQKNLRFFLMRSPLPAPAVH